MNSIKELLKMIFGKEKEETKLNDRIEFRLNDNEKKLIKEYCDFKRITLSDYFRSLAMNDINKFFNINTEEINKLILANETKKPLLKNNNLKSWIGN